VSIRLAVTGPLTLTGSVNAPAVDLTATGAIVQTGGSLTATLLTGSGASAALGSAGNTVATLGLFSTAGDFALADGQALIVGGAVSVDGGRSLSLASDSIGIGEGGSLSAVGGTVALAPLTAGHAFALSSAVPIAAISGGAITASTLRIGSATTGDISIAGAFGLSQVGTLDLRSAGAVLEGVGDSLVVNTLTGGANSASLLGTNNRIGTLGGFATNAGFTLVDAQGLAVTGPVSDAVSVSITAPNLTVAGSITAPTVSLAAAGSSVGGGALTQTGGVIGASTQLSLSAAGGIQQTSGSMAAGLLTGSSSGVVGLDSAGNAIATLGTFAAGRGFRLSDGQALTVAGPVTDPVSIGLKVAGALTLAGSVTAPLVDLAATGAITQTAGSLTATLLTGSGASAALGSADNAVTTLGNFTTAGDFALADGQALTVGGTVSVGGGATLSLASKQISLGAASQLLAPGGTVAFAPLTPGTALTLGSFVPSGGSIVANNLRVGSATTGDIGISGMFDLSAVNTLELRSAGNIIEAADAVIRVGTLTGQANSAQLLGLNQIDVLGGFAVAGPVSAAAGNVVLDTRSSASADVTIAAAGGRWREISACWRGGA